MAPTGPQDGEEHNQTAAIETGAEEALLDEWAGYDTHEKEEKYLETPDPCDFRRGFTREDGLIVGLEDAVGLYQSSVVT